ncbi:hypothetical protein ES703_90931 [subsurface metagenome]
MTAYHPENPLIVQGDHTVLVEVDSPLYEKARDALMSFAELIKSPEHIHTYRITPLSIWNACAAGVRTEEINEALNTYSKYPVPEHVAVEIRDYASRYGRLKITREDQGLILRADNAPLAEEIFRNRNIGLFLQDRLTPLEFLIQPEARGRIKQALIKIGFPAEDLAGYTEGEVLPINLRNVTKLGEFFKLRAYQEAAAAAFYAAGSARGGSGVIVLPCGAGKTIVGMACMDLIKASTLILVTNVTAVRQWISELLDKTNLQSDQVGEYSGSCKEIRPVTVSTYQIMTYRKSREDDFLHMSLFDERNWGLIIYDEVHLLPAPVFQITAGLQARRRLGMTATLVREDGREDDVFALIGPKKTDVPWKELEMQGWIAKARCTEIRIPMPENLRMPYAVADRRRKFRIASENPNKVSIILELLKKHPEEQILIIGMYLDQVKEIAGGLNVPVLTGSTAQKKRDQLFEDFKS